MLHKVVYIINLLHFTQRCVYNIILLGYVYELLTYISKTPKIITRPLKF